MSEPSPARVLRDQAEAMLKPGHEIAFATDDRSYTDAVLVAIARPGWCGVLTIDKAEWTLQGALAFAALMGFQEAKAPAMDRAKAAAKNRETKPAKRTTRAD